MEEKKLGRRERKKIASRQAILTAAKQEFVRQGYKDASIADIMERADLGVGTFYNYFSSKEEILMSLLVGLMGEVTEEQRGEGGVGEGRGQAGACAPHGGLPGDGASPR